MRKGNEGGQPGQAPEGGVPNVGPVRGGKPLTGVDGPNGWMDGFESLCAVPWRVDSCMPA